MERMIIKINSKEYKEVLKKLIEAVGSMYYIDCRVIKKVCDLALSRLIVLGYYFFDVDELINGSIKSVELIYPNLISY